VSKPLRQELVEWHREPTAGGMGFKILGRTANGARFETGPVLSLVVNAPFGMTEVETLNWRYCLLGEPDDRTN
jgi:hypothetical protein